MVYEQRRDAVFDVPDIESLLKTQIRGKIPLEIEVMRQIARCNIALSNIDPEIFNANVRALLAMLPSQKRLEIKYREKEFNETITRYQYRYYGPRRIGSPETPIKNIDGTIISPTSYEEEQTDYERLYEIILSTLEASNLTWRVERKDIDVGNVVSSNVPKGVINEAENKIVEVLINARKTNSDMTWDMIIESLRERRPATPGFKREKETYDE